MSNKRIRRKIQKLYDNFTDSPNDRFVRYSYMQIRHCFKDPEDPSTMAMYFWLASLRNIRAARKAHNVWNKKWSIDWTNPLAVMRWCYHYSRISCTNFRLKHLWPPIRKHLTSYGYYSGDCVETWQNDSTSFTRYLIGQFIGTADAMNGEPHQLIVMRYKEFIKNQIGDNHGT